MSESSPLDDPQVPSEVPEERQPQPEQDDDLDLENDLAYSPKDPGLWDIKGG